MPTTDLRLSIAAVLSLAMAVAAQETPTPTASPTSTATPAPARSVRISFLPPPLEGTISLGIYDGGGKLVRILLQEAELDEFTVGADALVTKWDGKNDEGEEVPMGTYEARGFVVAPMKIEQIGGATDVAPPRSGETVRLKLVSNPLMRGDPPAVTVSIGFDDENCYLRTIDGLPLRTIVQSGHISKASLTQRPDGSLDVDVLDEQGFVQYRIKGADKMMAFDGGEFELK